MKIDNRIFLPFIGPFVLLGLIRALWWLAGAEWSDPEPAAVASLIFGILGGALFAETLSYKGVSIGHFTIGKRRGGDQ